MSHRTIVYPNGMVEVEFDDNPFVCGELGCEVDVDPHCYGVEDTEQAGCDVAAVDPVSDALDVLDAHFAETDTDTLASMHLTCVRNAYNEQVWAKQAGHSRD